MKWTEERSFGARFDNLTRSEYKEIHRPTGKETPEAYKKRWEECEEFNLNAPEENWGDFEAATKLGWRCEEDFGQYNQVVVRFCAYAGGYRYRAEIRYWDDNESDASEVEPPKTKLEEILILCLKEKLAEPVKKP
jgi:hypothetical protein